MAHNSPEGNRERMRRYRERIKQGLITPPKRIGRTSVRPAAISAELAVKVVPGSPVRQAEPIQAVEKPIEVPVQAVVAVVKPAVLEAVARSLCLSQSQF